MATFRPETNILGYASRNWAFYFNFLLLIYVMHYFKTCIFKRMSSNSSSFHANQAVIKTVSTTHIHSIFSQVFLVPDLLLVYAAVCVSVPFHQPFYPEVYPDLSVFHFIMS